MEQLAVTKPKRHPKRQIKMGCISYAKLVKLMLEGIYDCKELAEMTGLSYVCVCHYAREMHREGAAHIAAWGQDGNGARFTRKVYKIGEGTDAPRKRMDRSEINARYKARKEMQTTLHRMAGKL